MAQTPPAPFEELQQRDREIHRSYDRTVLWSRRFLAAFFGVFALSLLWALPWDPVASSRYRYNDRVFLQAMLSLVAAAFAFGAVYLRDRLRRAEKTLVAWTAVHDRLTGLRQREFFFDRLELECERCRGADSGPAVVVLRIAAADAREPDLRLVDKAMQALQPLVASIDCLALISPREIGVMFPDTAASDIPAIAEDARSAIVGAAAIRQELKVEAGWAIFEDSCNDAADLVGKARAAVYEREQSSSAA